MRKKLKPIIVLLMWLITLAIGFFVALMIFGQADIALVTTVLAAFFSLPYLIVMMIVGSKFTNFWKLQLTHLAFATVTAYVIYIIAEKFVSEMFWMPWVYFVIGGLVHAYFWFKKDNKIENDAK